MKRVVVGLSGGVDSSVIALLLKKQGYEVIAAFMRNWDSFANHDFLGNNDDDEQCSQEKDFKDAQKIAKQLDIPLKRVDFIKEYWNKVFQYFIKEYEKGRTPNPDILCNKYIKFDYFTQYAFKDLKADYVAMGHYAITKNGFLYRGKDPAKDQSYFLSQLSNKQLEKILFPLGEMQKSKVREIAHKNNLATATKRDSTGICFIGKRDFAKFLENYIPNKNGDIVDATNNKIVGTHIGVMYYTLGQRKGLNLGGMSEPYFVVGNSVEKRILFVAPQSQLELLTTDMLIAEGFNQISKVENWNNLSAKFRYRQKDIKIQLKILKNKKIQVFYPQGFQAVTPGQEVVIYELDKVIGGATIDKTFYKDIERKF